MTLRLRLTLFTTLLVALVLAASGAGLHLLFARSLSRGLDESLQQAAVLLAGFIETEDDRDEPASLKTEADTAPVLRADLVALLFDPDGNVLDTVGNPPDPLPPTPRGEGLSTQGAWRSWTQSVYEFTLVVMRPQGVITESLSRFDVSFLILAPVAILLAFVLGYALLGRALLPVGRLTRAAYDLANRRAWRERLPEPRRQDELWRLTRGTNELLATLEGVIESERRFTADAAHELRTPLTVLQGRLEKASENSSDDKVTEAIDKARKASNDLIGLVEKLLTIARTEAGQGFQSDRVALDEITFESAELLRPLFSQKGVALNLELPETPLWIQGDETALGLAVRNLLDNALKFAPCGEVTLVLTRETDTALLCVEDMGPGIPEEALPHLFDRFYQADVRFRRSGSGMGLALVRSIAKWHGGDAHAANRSAGGARFSLTLPLATVNTPGRPVTATPPSRRPSGVTT